RQICGRHDDAPRRPFRQSAGRLPPATAATRQRKTYDAIMAEAQAQGAITLTRPRHEPQGFIQRIELADAAKLAALLGQETRAAQIRHATETLAACLADYPVLHDVLAAWAKLKNVRQTTPEHAGRWHDACQTVSWCRAQERRGITEMALRDASAQLFQDSKRIEKLLPCLDVLLTGNLTGEARADTEILQELGLYREPQPVRLAGNVLLRRTRGDFPPDFPYSALPPSAIHGLAAQPAQILTIENLTTFHGWARQHGDSNTLCLYTAGMPSPAWRALYGRLLAGLPQDVPVYHWGDIDEGGFRIAALLSRCAAACGHTLRPWKMRPAEIPASQHRPAAAHTLAQMAKYARDAGWDELACEVETAGIVAEQEG
ncbi:Wadjet anti-phage system protein JetD domain-containing protein, partial [uncultured Cardiobacterium sp.]|uniref:Wadjet anti-phage system protein JetD domain-containing protein n=1 Tax=uncultured Cardiobacterium sp. TaxID=417619 RepID=UPI00260658C8